MTQRRFSYTIEDELIELSCVGETTFGGAEVLFEQDDNLVARSDWKPAGYKIVPFLTAHERDRLRQTIADLVQGEIEKVTGKAVPGFRLDQYHHHVDDEQHRQIVRTMIKVGLPSARVPIPLERFNSVVSEVCGSDLEVRQFVEKPWSARISSIRIARPMARDANPPHRDVWTESSRNLVNVYVPIAGSNIRSSLSLIPGSHLWQESEIERTIPGSTLIDNIPFSVGCAISSKYGLKMIRPDPKEDEVLVFTPYLIHGGARNFNPDLTRVSLEMRFQRRGSSGPFYVGGMAA